MNRIIYIDDNPAKIQEFISNLSNYQVIPFENPFEALESLENLEYDGIILDIMIPLIDGFQLFERITKSKAYGGQPIFFHSSSNDLDIKLRALSLGSCELLTPDMSWPEKLVRIKNKLNTKNQESSYIDELIFHLNTFKVQKEGFEIELTPKEFFLFKLVFENKGISTFSVIDEVWGELKQMSENNLSTHFSNLNKKIKVLGLKVASKRGNVFVRTLD